MKRNEVEAIFPGATKEQIDAVLNGIGSELNPLKANLKAAEEARDANAAALGEAQAQAADYKTRLDSATAQLGDATAKLQEGMTAEELLQQREAAAAAKEREFTMKANALDAKPIFVGAGCFEAAEIDQLVEQVTTEDAEVTKQFAQRIVDTVAKQRELVEKATKDAMLKSNPSLDGNQGGGIPTTVKDFLALPYDKQLELKKADPNIISKLTE